MLSLYRKCAVEVSPVFLETIGNILVSAKDDVHCFLLLSDIPSRLSDGIAIIWLRPILRECIHNLIFIRSPDAACCVYIYAMAIEKKAQRISTWDQWQLPFLLTAVACMVKATLNA